MTEEALRITSYRVSAVRSCPTGQVSPWSLIYAPGAGSNLQDPFGQFLAGRMAEEGIATLRFQFPYMEAGRRRPDPARLLEEVWREAIEFARPTAGRMAIGGRSMGGRIASQVVAKGVDVDGLALFAYPLHPPANPERQRVEHLPAIAVPTLFCSGTRDAFSSPEELKQAASVLSRPTVRFLEGADHGFAVLKSSGKTKEDVWKAAADTFLTWLAGID